MKIAHLVMLPALLFAFCGTTQAQMPGYPMPGAPAYGQYPGRPMNFADPMPMAAGAAPGAEMMANPMPGAPAHPEALSGRRRQFRRQDCYGSCGPGSVRAACGYGYIQADALYWRREHGWHVSVFNASLDPNVNFINGSNLNYRMEVLPRLTAGYVLANGLAVEGTYYYKDDFRYVKASPVPATSTTWLRRTRRSRSASAPRSTQPTGAASMPRRRCKTRNQPRRNRTLLQFPRRLPLDGTTRT